ncbi:unnamed protein product (macronuclear) [Paramecium tetraurelia]|uniref:Uncharacterized protein n=1 Tax=Paramecium tetraurelia TaxID=5888 RepID=A0E5E7_PARTE|nr:uncharacterized protein GSPATT00023691001 [Paramecium tetraurelia]CAK90514.1 unnamed protein product [Paramecium tetraurelia]|eukprot:XP_001457911.1 hypothetical protein (macronuclear) [Paramecium tetraurelia strain d4-2]
MQCTYHPQNSITVICIAPHICQRKLCAECQYDHNVDLKKIIPINIFRQLMIKKFQDCKIGGTLEFQDMKNSSKQRLSNSENEFKSLLGHLTEQIKQTQEMLEKQEESYLDLIYQNENFVESSITVLQQLVQILNGSILDEWNDKKKSYVSKMKLALDQFDVQVQICFEKLKEEMKIIQQIIQMDNDEKFKWQEGIQEYKCRQWDYYGQKFINTKFLIKFTKEKEIQYIRDGSILRSQNIKNIYVKPEVLSNLEQIQYLRWFGKYNYNNQNVGKWIATWRGEGLRDVGGQYSDDGKKKGLWKELIPDYWNKTYSQGSGVYMDGKRRQTWKYIYKDQELCGGEYNENGEKNGNWKEFWQGFWEKSFVINKGEYRNGKKIGKWEMLYKPEDDNQYKKIGGGQYDLEGSEIKTGEWNELREGFWDKSQVIYSGVYDNGKKVGKWEIFYKQQKIGGGEYDKGNGIQIGEWIELSEGFWDRSQVTYSGNYQNGKKAGRWNIQNQTKQIGGGSYHEAGSGIKVGQWTEIREGFWDRSQVTDKGEYKEGKKIGQWDTYYENKQIAGGKYDEQGNQHKVGQWVDLSDGFYEDQQVTYCGEYKNNKKVGKWETSYQNKKIGGGQYDLEGEGFKIGQWIDLNDAFQYYSQVSYNGEYQNGKKTGRWDINYQGTKIGGGSYDEKGDGTQVGQWIELDDGFWEKSQITYVGMYKNGRKISKWEILHKGTKIGGGYYDGDNGLKLGKWTELKDGFYYMSQIAYIGEYESGKKFGTWVEMDLTRNQKLNEYKFYR